MKGLAFLKKNQLAMLFMLVLLVMVIIPETSWALTANGLFPTVMGKLFGVFRGSKLVVLVIGGFGLIAIGFLAIFGKVKWGWLAGLSFGLAAVAAAGAIVYYVTEDINFSDTESAMKMSDTYRSIGGNYGKVNDVSME